MEDVYRVRTVYQFKPNRDAVMSLDQARLFDTIEWSNQLDIDPEFLYEKSVKAEV